jgi:hypothetical protein
LKSPSKTKHKQKHKQKQRGVSHCESFAIFTLKKYHHLKAKEEEEEEVWKLKNISPCKNYIIFKKLSAKKKPKILQDKYHLKAKEEEELWKLKNISPCKNYIIFKKYPLNRNQNPSR